MTQYLERSFNATYGYELSESETHLLWSAIVTMKSLGLIIGAEAGKSLLNSLSIHKSLKNISEEAWKCENTNFKNKVFTWRLKSTDSKL